MKKLFAAACIVTPLLTAAPTSLALPDTEYACKVQTKSIQIGVVFVQAHNLAAAGVIAAESPATGMNGKTEPVHSVLECRPYPGENFGDAGFQAFLSALPR